MFLTNIFLSRRIYNSKICRIIRAVVFVGEAERSADIIAYAIRFALQKRRISGGQTNVLTVWLFSKRQMTGIEMQLIV